MLAQLTPTRFAAIAVVVLFHFGGGLPGLACPWIGPVLRDGPLAVTWFFTLSGFLMACVHPELGRDEAASFWVKRFARIYPLFALALVLEGAVVLGSTPASQPVTWLLNALLLQAWVPGYAATLNSPSWSLSVEMFCYALFPALVAGARRLGPAGFAAAALLFWAVSQAVFLAGMNRLALSYPSPLFDVLNYGPATHLNAFVVGMSASLLCRRHRPGQRAGLVLVALGLGASLLVLLAGPGLAARHGVLLYANAGLLAPLFAVTLCGLTEADLPPLRWPPLLLLGEASYAVYLLQFPLYSGWLRYVRPRLAAGPVPAFALFCAALVAVGVAAHLGIERPCRAWLRRLLVRGPSQPKAKVAAIR